MTFAFEAPPIVTLPISGSDLQFPVRRVFCVGRNYVAHATEMGGEVDREAPWYFNKSAHAVALSGQTLPYALETANYHHEMELVVALGQGAFRATPQAALDAVYGYACGLDMTRRDLQQVGKDHRRPWDLGKDIENGAVIAPITQAKGMDLAGRAIGLSVNGETRQDARLDDMVWSVAEIIAHLSRFYHLQAGDLIMTGTPAGVGPVQPGDVVRGWIDGLDDVTMTVGPAELCKQG